MKLTISFIQDGKLSITTIDEDELEWYVKNTTVHNVLRTSLPVMRIYTRAELIEVLDKLKKAKHKSKE